MQYSNLLYILPIAVVLDLVLGDPRWLPHPIRWMGNAITYAEPRFRRLPTGLFVSGALFSMFLIFSAWALSFILVSIAGIVSLPLQNIIEIILIYYCISIRSLEESALEVYTALKQHNLPEAKKKVSMIVGRDVTSLSEDGVARAAVETVAENFVDGVVSPLFFAAIGGAPLAIAYKMINTLDSMVGYKNDKYQAFGKFAARTDDAANFIPARISIPVISLVAQLLVKKGRIVFETAVRQGKCHTSPNAGYSEAAFAGTLGVRLGGPNYYGGVLISKPYIGTEFGDISLIHIKKACDIMMLSSFLWLGILVIVRLIFILSKFIICDFG